MRGWTDIVVAAVVGEDGEQQQLLYGGHGPV